MPRAISPNGHNVFQLLQTVAQMGSPILFEFIMSRSEIQDQNMFIIFQSNRSNLCLCCAGYLSSLHISKSLYLYVNILHTTFFRAEKVFLYMQYHFNRQNLTPDLLEKRGMKRDYILENVCQRLVIMYTSHMVTFSRVLYFFLLIPPPINLKIVCSYVVLNGRYSVLSKERRTEAKSGR